MPGKAGFTGWGAKKEEPKKEETPAKAGFSGWGAKKEEPKKEEPTKEEPTPAAESDKFSGWGGLEDKSGEEDKGKGLDKSGDNNKVKRAAASTTGVQKSQTAHRK